MTVITSPDGIHTVEQKLMSGDGVFRNQQKAGSLAIEVETRGYTRPWWATHWEPPRFTVNVILKDREGRPLSGFVLPATQERSNISAKATNALLTVSDVRVRAEGPAPNVTDSEGRMYFTGLKEGDIAPTVLMPGDLARSKIISECFKEAHFVNGRRTYYTYTGVTQNDVPVTALSSGMGPLAVSTVAEECAQIGCKNLIRVGTGAALLTDYEPGRIIIATGCVRGDGNSYEYVPAEYPAAADPYVVEALIRACKEFGEDPIVGLYRAHDSYYRETNTAMVDTRKIHFICVTAVYF